MNNESKMTESEDENRTILNKIISLAEVILVRHGVYTIAALGLLILIYGTTSPEPFPLEASYLIGSLWFIIPAVLIFGLGRKGKDYGLTLQKSPESIDLAFNAFPYFLLTFAGYVLLMMIGLPFLEPLGAMIMTGVFIISTLLIARLISKKYSNFEDVQLPQKKHNENIIGLIILLMFPILLGLAIGSLSMTVISTVVWQFVFSGFGEEVFFRGYIQSRLNQSFGRPYEWKGIQFGLGLFITAGLFAISHMFSTADIVLGDFTIDWWYGTFTFVGGLLFGLLREKTRSVVASGTLHGLEAVGEGIAAVFG